MSVAAIGTVLFSSFGCMALGIHALRSNMLAEPARKGVAALYARVVFPTMVFMGVADIDLAAVDRSMLVVILASKATLAALVVAYAYVTLRRSQGPGSALAHAGAWAMAASHSFDVTLGVPLAKVLHPSSVAYAYLNQSVQLVLVNPVLLMLMEASGTNGSNSSSLGKALREVVTNPLVVMTLLGLLANIAFPAGLPAAVMAFGRQVASAGPFLGFLALGFAMGSLGGTSSEELGVCAGLCAFKLVLMPLLYLTYARILGCDAAPALLTFLGTLPASASVYSLTLTKNLSPKIVGPLVPSSMLLCVALALLPLWPAPRAAELLRGVIGVAGIAMGLRAAAVGGIPSGAKRD